MKMWGCAVLGMQTIPVLQLLASVVQFVSGTEEATRKLQASTLNKGRPVEMLSSAPPQWICWLSQKKNHDVILWMQERCVRGSCCALSRTKIMISLGWLSPQMYVLFAFSCFYSVTYIVMKHIFFWTICCEPILIFFGLCAGITSFCWYNVLWYI